MPRGGEREREGISSVELVVVVVVVVVVVSVLLNSCLRANWSVVCLFVCFLK